MVSNRVRRSFVTGAVLALTSLLPSPHAQEAQTPVQTALGPTAPRDFSHDVPAHIAFVEGEVTLERDGKLEPAERNLALLAGDRVRTRSGRVEILYADSSTLAVDHETSLDLLSDSLVRLLGGRLRVAILRTTETLDYRIDSAAGSIGIQVAGEYRVQTGTDADGDPDVDLTVIRGSAELVNDNGRTLVRAGRHAFTSAKTAPSLPYNVNSAAWDDFDHWVEDRRTSRVGSVSSAYLPEEVQYYGNTLDDYGTWGTDPAAGAVWYPRVSDDWVPYSQGRWSYTGYYGWVWVGIDAWSWPTHHYGSWGYSNRWYWIPNNYWGPAWVTWVVSPAYVSWCARGYDGRPVGGFPANGGYKYGEPWRTWTTLPATQMTHNVWVPEHTVARNTITPAVRDSFVERPGGPMPAGTVAPRRSIAPLHAPTAPGGPSGATAPRNGAVPRGQTHDGNVGPFDAARVPRAGSSPSRGPVTYTVPTASGASADRTSGTPPPSRLISAPSPDRTPSVPPRDRTQGASSPDRTPIGSATSRDRMPAGPAPSIDRSSTQPSRAPRATTNAPRATLPQVEILRGTPDPPPAAVPRNPEPPQAAPPAQDRGRSANRAVPPPSYQSAPPSSQPAPPSVAYPARRADPQAPPQAAPPQAMPPPSYNRGSDRPAPQPSAPPPSAQPSAPPAGAAPPPATARPSGRGGGGGQTQSQGQAVPRRGGGGGGDR